MSVGGIHLLLSISSALWRVYRAPKPWYRQSLGMPRFRDLISQVIKAGEASPLPLAVSGGLQGIRIFKDSSWGLCLGAVERRVPRFEGAGSNMKGLNPSSQASQLYWPSLHHGFLVEGRKGEGRGGGGGSWKRKSCSAALGWCTMEKWGMFVVAAIPTESKTKPWIHGTCSGLAYKMFSTDRATTRSTW